MEKLVIMDFSTSTIHFYQVDTDRKIDDNFIIDLGFNPSSCSWIYDKFIDVKKHRNIL